MPDDAMTCDEKIAAGVPLDRHDPEDNPYLIRLKYVLNQLGRVELYFLNSVGNREHNALGRWFLEISNREITRRAWNEAASEAENMPPREEDPLWLDVTDWNGEDLGAALTWTNLFASNTKSVELGAFYDRVHDALVFEAGVRLRRLPKPEVCCFG